MVDLKSGEVVDGAGDARGRESRVVRIGGAVSFSNITYSYLFVNRDLRIGSPVGLFEEGSGSFQTSMAGSRESARWFAAIASGARRIGQRFFA